MKGCDVHLANSPEECLKIIKDLDRIDVVIIGAEFAMDRDAMLIVNIKKLNMDIKILEPDDMIEIFGDTRYTNALLFGLWCHAIMAVLMHWIDCRYLKSYFATTFLIFCKNHNFLTSMYLLNWISFC